MRLRKRLYGIEGVTPGGVATLNIPCNARYHDIRINVSGTDSLAAAVTDASIIVKFVRLIVNGIVMRDLFPADIINLAKLNGITPPAGELPMYFSEPWRATVTGEETYAMDLTGQTSCVLEIGFQPTSSALATCAATVTAATDDGHTVVYDVNTKANTIIRTMMKQRRMSFVAGAAGIQDITNIPINKPIHRVHFMPTTGTISKVEVLADNVRVTEMSKAENDAYLASYKLDGTAFGAGSFSLVFDYEQQVTSALIPTESLVVKPTTSAGCTINYVLETRSVGFA